jgi:hypothetical protein
VKVEDRSRIETKKKGSVTLINLRDYKEIKISIGEPIKYGFHSFFEGKIDL